MQLPKRAINSESRIIVRRTLPVNGEVLVKRGQQVDALKVVARAELPRRYRVINVARQLARPEVAMDEVMLKTEGELAEANEAIAVLKGRLPFLQRSARAPVAGRIAAIGPGWVLLETERTTIELQAFVSGTISRVIPNRGVVIESRGAMVEAACGFGGEAYGRLKRLVGSPYESIEEEALDESVKQTILLGGRAVDEALLRKAEEMQVRGIIVGSIDGSLMNLEPLPKVRVVATEGFGDVPMSSYTFGILTALSGRQVSIRGQTPNLVSPATRETEMERPIVLATTSRVADNVVLAKPAAESPVDEVKIGSRVRVTRGKLLEASGQIDLLPPVPQVTEAGNITAGAYVNIDNTSYYIPWANLEQVK